MTWLLLRHARAGNRRSWVGDDRLRPLTQEGYEQAEAVSRVLADLPIRAIVTSPFVRCVETVVPLATKLGLPIVEDEALAEGAPLASITALLTRVGHDTVLCTHGDVLEAALSWLRSQDVALPEDPPLAKPSVWAVTSSNGRPTRARYLTLPASYP